MGKNNKEYYYAVATPSLQQAAQGKLPDKTNEKVTFYASAQEAAGQISLMKQNELFEFDALGPNGSIPKQPMITGLYRVELSEAEIHRMNNVTPAFGSAGRWSGSIPKGAGFDVQWCMSSDMLHDTYHSSVETAINGQFSNAELIMAAKVRSQHWQSFEDAIYRTSEHEREKIDISRPDVARAAMDVYGAGLMSQDPSKMSFEQAYGQQLLRPITDNQPLDVSLQASGVYRSYSDHIKSLATVAPGLSESERAVAAMQETLKTFSNAAYSSHRLLDQQAYREMHGMNQACAQMFRQLHERDHMTALQQFADTVMNSPANSVNHSQVANEVVQNIQRDQLHEMSGNADFPDEQWFDEGDIGEIG